MSASCSLLPVPEILQVTGEGINAAVHMLFPFSWEQSLAGRTPEAFIQKQNHPLVFVRPDHAPCRLQHFIHSGVLIGVGKTVHSLSVKIILYDLPFPAYLRKSRPDHQRADQPVVCQVDPF